MPISRNSPYPKGTKVILTIRDSDEVWQNSMKNFWIQETKRDALFGISVKDQRLYNILFK